MLQRVIILSATYYLQFTGAASAECRDLNGRRIAQGIHYVPGPDACTLCVCDSGNPKWCKAVLCSPPQDCKSFRVGNTCCEFICLDDTLSKSDSVLDLDGNTDLGLRLVASAITAILSLSILFFLVHRIRQRKIRGRQNRQLSEDERSLGSIGYIAGSIGYLQGSMGYLGNGSNDLEFHYEEPPSHYPLWKPPGNYFPRGEAPPPYEEAVAAARAEAALIATTTTVVPPSSTHQYSTNHNIPLSHPTTAPSTTSRSSVTNQLATISTPNNVNNSTSSSNSGYQHRNDVSTNTVRTESIPRSVVVTHQLTAADSLINSAGNSEHSKIKNSDTTSLVVRELTSNRSILRNANNNNSMTTSSHSTSNNHHRTIPKNLTVNNTSGNETVSTVDTHISSISRRDNQTTITPTIEFKSLPKRSSKERTMGEHKSIRSDVYYEDITPQPTSSREIHATGHRTIPRHLSANGLSNNCCSKTYSTHNISGTHSTNSTFAKETNSTVPLSRPNSIHYPVMSVISLPTSPVPPPGVFGNNVNSTHSTSESLSQCDAKDGTLKVKNSTSKLNIKNSNSSNNVGQVQKISSQEIESSLDGSYQCLHQTFDDEDYRSECENCKSAHGSRYYLAGEDEDELSSPNETMTLQRRPLEPQTDTLGHGPTYYRTSLTLPTNTKKLRSTSMHGTPSNHGAREAWFSSMPESTSSEED